MIPKGFSYIKKYKKALIVENAHKQCGIGVRDPRKPQNMLLVPLVDKHFLPLKRNQLLHTREFHPIVENCYKDFLFAFRHEIISLGRTSSRSKGV